VSRAGQASRWQSFQELSKLRSDLSLAAKASLAVLSKALPDLMQRTNSTSMFLLLKLDKNHRRVWVLVSAIYDLVHCAGVFDTHFTGMAERCLAWAAV
jgi:hypothetical protein